MRPFVKCSSNSPCFGKTFGGTCRVLTTPYPDGRCPFQKEEQYMTKGRYLPYSETYTGRELKEWGATKETSPEAQVSEEW